MQAYCPDVSDRWALRWLRSNPSEHNSISSRSEQRRSFAWIGLGISHDVLGSARDPDGLWGIVLRSGWLLADFEVMIAALLVGYFSLSSSSCEHESIRASQGSCSARLNHVISYDRDDPISGHSSSAWLIAGSTEPRSQKSRHGSGLDRIGSDEISSGAISGWAIPKLSRRIQMNLLEVARRLNH
jgi:hypothetical protein